MPSDRIGDYFDPPLPDDETVGVRVLLDILTDAGKHITRTVTVNVLAQASINDIDMNAAEFYAEGGLAARGSGTSGGEVWSTEIGAVFEGGYSDPALFLGATE